MLLTGFQMDNLRVESGTMIGDAPVTAEGYDTELDYRMSYVGSFIGAVVAGYTETNVAPGVNPPTRLQVDFKSGSAVLVRVYFSYQDAIRFRSGEITANQFIARWTVE
jgi:hypothetical protein